MILATTSVATKSRRAIFRTGAGAFLLVVCGLLLSSCDLTNGDFVDRSAKGGASEDVLSERQGGVEAVLLGVYDALDGVGNNGPLGGGHPGDVSPYNWPLASVSSGMAHKGSTPGDGGWWLTLSRMEHTPETAAANSLWKARYEGVSRANSVLTLLERQDDMDEEQKTRIAAEARFLRGHFYFDLKRNFGNIPWIDETTEDVKQPNTGSDHPDIWTKIEEDFQFAMDNLPEVQSDVGRVNRWAAAAYLAKTYLYQEQWQDAQSLFDEVITSGNTSDGTGYALQPAYQSNLKPSMENSSEAVFSVQQKRPQGTLWGGGTFDSRYGFITNYPWGPQFKCCGFLQPSLWLVNSFRVDDQGLPKHFDPADGENVKNDQGVGSGTEFQLGEQPVDPRLDWTVGRRGVPFKDWGPHPGASWIREQPSGGPFSPVKHIPWQRNDPSLNQASSLNYKIIRFADVLLMGAEAHAQVGNLEQARQYVNRVRERAGNPESQVSIDLNEQFATAVVDSEEEMLATDANQFDWVIRTDRNSTFVLINSGAENRENWNEYEIPEYKVSPYPASAFSSTEEAMKRIRLERKLELALEGHRFYDLVRWGLPEQRIEAFYEFSVANLVPTLQGSDFTPNKNEVFPIPQRQIDLSREGGEPILEQNPGYLQ